LQLDSTLESQLSHAGFFCMKIDTLNARELTPPAPDSTSEGTETGVGRYLKRRARVTEEQLFGASVADRIQSSVGDEAVDQFQIVFRQEKAKLRAETGKRSVEQAALNAMQTLTDSGVLTESERDKVYNQAFKMAQFDDDDTSLEDGKEPGKAVTTRSEAISMADQTSITVNDVDDERPFSLEATSVEVEAAYVQNVDMKGFLWKPISESDGKLVTLMPNSLTGQVQQVNVLDLSGNIVDTGRFAGNANGGRDHFRFNRDGSSFELGSYLELTLDTGELVKIDIPDPAQRYEK
jgi:hypothetical protein